MVLLVVAGAVVAIVAVGLLLIRFGNDGGGLASVPGYGLDFPAGSLIVVHKIPGALGASSQEDRVYGTAAPVEEIETYFDEQLQDAGYRKVQASEGDGPGDRFLGKYKRGKVSWLVILRPLPQRIDGYTYNPGDGGFQRVVVVRIEG